MTKWIYRYLRGYIIVELKGNTLERLINKLSNSGILIWDIQRVNNGFKFKILAKDYHRLRPILRYRKCTIRICKKIGCPFLKHRIVQRRALLIGLIVFFILLKSFSMFLWDIRIEGNQRISTEEIQMLLKETGIEKGMLLKNVDIKKLEHALITGNSDIAWAGAALYGTSLRIKIVEKEKLDKTNLTDIIATKPGIITQLIVLKGKPMVKEGDTVTAGQVLIKAANKFETFAQPDFTGNLPPYLPSPDEEPEPAKGIVKARVWYEGYGEAYFNVTEELPLNNRERVIKVKIGDKIFHFSGPHQIDFEHYTVEKEVKSISLWRNITLPIEIIKEDYVETAIFTERRSPQTALFLAKEKALKDILNYLAPDAIIIQSNYYVIDTKKDNNIVRVKVIFEVEENIARPLPR